MSKVKILAVSPDRYGVGKYRIIDPFKYIGDNFINDIHVDISYDVENDDKVFDEYNIVIFHSFIHNLPHEENIKRINYLKSKGIKVIMDIDDLWFIDQRHPMFHKARHEKMSEKKVELLKLADYVTTTTPIFQKTLKDKLRLKNVLVFPNAIDNTDKQFIPKPRKSDKVRFGWLGGSTHLHDIELLKNGISGLHYSHTGKVQFVLCGFDLRGVMTEINTQTGESTNRPIKPEETVWYKYEKIFTDNYRVLDKDYAEYLQKFTKEPYDDSDKPYIRRWTEDVTIYGNNYNYFDVSLAPLVETQFNANKSQLKIIEAGFHKKAIIASEVEPYTLDLISASNSGVLNDKGNALLVDKNKNHKQWAQHMKRLADNPSLIEDLGNRLYETVKNKFALSTVCKDRVEFFKSII